MARKKIGEENRITRSIRIEPRKLKLIEKRHNTFQAWLDRQIEIEMHKEDPTKLSDKTKKVLVDQILALIETAYSL